MSEPIRILMINSKMQCAGIENMIMNYYRHIDRSRVQFDFLVHYKERQHFDDEIENMGGKIYRLSIREDYNMIRYLRDLMAFFKEHREYRVVHGHMESFGMFYLRAAKKAGVPVRIAHAHVTGTDDDWKGRMKNIMNRFYGRYANLLFTCSDNAAEYCFGKGRKAKRIQNAIDVKKFEYSEELRNQLRKELNVENKFVIGHVGRFFVVKNHSFLLDAFADACKKRDDLVLLLCGDGELMEKMQQKAQQLGVADKVIFRGQRSDVYREYQVMDLFVLPSVSEAMPFVAVEAQSAGLPCAFSTGVGGEAKLSSDCTYLPLDIKAWSDFFVNQKQRSDRSNGIEDVRRMGYDIQHEAEQLMGYYEKLYNGEEL